MILAFVNDVLVRAIFFGRGSQRIFEVGVGMMMDKGKG